jgi:hypothetical protein
MKTHEFSSPLSVRTLTLRAICVLGCLSIFFQQTHKLICRTIQITPSNQNIVSVLTKGGALARIRWPGQEEADRDRAEEEPREYAGREDQGIMDTRKDRHEIDDHAGPGPGAAARQASDCCATGPTPGHAQEVPYPGPEQWRANRQKDPVQESELTVMHDRLAAAPSRL